MRFFGYNGDIDKYVRQTIDARKNAFSASFKISAEMQKEIENLFSEIEELGKRCKDVSEFEAEFAKSPLNQQYLDMFTKVATNSQPISQPEVPKDKIGKIVATNAAGAVASNIAYQAKSAVLPTRASINQKVYDKVRHDAPVVGSVLNVEQKLSYAAHLGGLIKIKKGGKRKKRVSREK